jgi:hypothetical protein
MFCFLRYSLDWQPAPGTEPQLAAPKNDRLLANRMSTGSNTIKAPTTFFSEPWKMPSTKIGAIFLKKTS